MDAARFLCLAGLSFALVAAPAYADVELSYEGAVATCLPELARVAVSGSRVRAESLFPGPAGTTRTVSIADLDEMLVYALDPDARTFVTMEIDPDATDYQGDVVRASDRSMQKATGVGMGELSSDPNAAMQQMMAKAQADAVEQLRRTDPKAAEQLEKQGMPDLSAMMAQAQAMQADTVAGGKTRRGMNGPRADERSGADMQAMLSAIQGGGGQAKQPAAGTMFDALTPPQRRETGRSDDVDGLKCSVVERTKGDRVVSEDCEVALTALPLAEPERKALARYEWLVKPLTSAVGDVMEKDDAFTWLARRRCFDERGDVAGEIRSRMGSESLSADEFEVPPGYTKTTYGG